MLKFRSGARRPDSKRSSNIISIDDYFFASLQPDMTSSPRSVRFNAEAVKLSDLRNVQLDDADDEPATTAEVAAAERSDKGAHSRTSRSFTFSSAQPFLACVRRPPDPPTYRGYTHYDDISFNNNVDADYSFWSGKTTEASMTGLVQSSDHVHTVDLADVGLAPLRSPSPFGAATIPRLERSSGTETAPIMSEQWSRMQFFWVCLGFSFGWRNLIGFPLTTLLHGQSAFIILYVLLSIVLAYPVVMLQAVLGHLVKCDMFSVWSALPASRGIGTATLTTTFFVSLSTSHTVAHSFYYCILSFKAALPWTASGLMAAAATGQPISASCDAQSSICPQDPVPEWHFLQSSIGEMGHPGQFNWLLAVTLSVCWLLIFVVLCSKLKRLFGMILSRLTVFCFGLFCLLTAQSLLQPNSDQGLALLYHQPHAEAFADWKVWSRAGLEALLCNFEVVGIYIQLSSKRCPTTNVGAPWWLVPCGVAVNVLLTLLSTCFVSGLMGAGLSKAAVGMDGWYQFTFITLPEMLTHNTVPNLWVFLYFLLLGLLEFITLSVLVDAFVSSIKANWSWAQQPCTWGRRACLYLMTSIALLACSMPFATSVGWDLCQMISRFALHLPCPFIALSMVFAILIVYSLNRLADDTGIKLPFVARFYLLLVMPGLLTILFVSVFVAEARLEYVQSVGWVAAGWFLVAATILQVPVLVVYQMAKKNGSGWADLFEPQRRLKEISNGEHVSSRSELRAPRLAA